MIRFWHSHRTRTNAFVYVQYMQCNAAEKNSENTDKLARTSRKSFRPNPKLQRFGSIRFLCTSNRANAKKELYCVFTLTVISSTGKRTRGIPNACLTHQN